MKILHLEWDSNFFKRNIGLLSNTEYDEIKDLGSFDLLYSINIKVNKIKGFDCTYEGNQLVFTKENLENSTSALQISSISSLPGLSVDKINDLAILSGNWSRFKVDKNFTREEFELLYKTWVQNSINKEVADDLLVYQENNIISGFLTYKIKDSKAIIGLLAVSPEVERSGIGTKLIKALEGRAVAMDLKSIEVKTQQLNIKAVKFYQKVGFKISEQIKVKHFWKK